ncbi:MAG TPA: glycosyltransferase family 4 protein [Myxococcales bacterium]|nr:glycosyltransferase family 4 protein [Myxococcales bacterium]
MRPLRVLTIGHSYVVRLNRSVAAALARRPGVEVTLAAPSSFHGDQGVIALERGEGEPYALEPVRSRLSRQIHVFSYAPADLEKLIRPGRFDVVHAWEEPYIVAGWQIGRAAARAGIPFCFRTAQSLVKRYPPPFSWFERATVARAAGWIAGGELVFRAMVDKGFPASRGAVITLGVGLDAFRPLSGEAVAAARRKLGLEPPLIGFLGRLVPQKGLPLLMRALEQVRPPWSLLLLGQGPMKAEIEDWARRRGLQSRVRVLAVRHDEVPELLGAMDLLVAPSQTTPRWKEQFGRMLIEAFACKVAVLASDSGEIPNVAGDGGRILPERDEAAWVRAISQLLEDPAERARLAEAGHRRCRERFAADALAERQHQFLLRAAGFAPAEQEGAGRPRPDHVPSAAPPS